MLDKKDFEHQPIYREKFKMATVNMASVINNKVLLTTSSQCYHTELIGNHYISIYGKIKKKSLRTRLPPPHTHTTPSMSSSSSENFLNASYNLYTSNLGYSLLSRRSLTKSYFGLHFTKSLISAFAACFYYHEGVEGRSARSAID